jgi:AP-3 complex subunit delta-1
MVFEKTLTDLVKGIRASKRDTALYISSCIAEIKSEINSTDPHTKANALQKLTFLQMMGYNMSYASFATIEVMSNTRFAFKRIGYLAASQAFTQDTDVVLLTTNTLKKELRGAVGPGMNGVYEAGLAINCLSNIVTIDLARDLLADVTNLTVHPQPYLRKKAILCLLKMFMKYPQGLRLTFSKLQDSLLKDINPSVTSCAVNVITELSDRNPKNYLVLAPSFFALLTSSSNNWMLIKVVKLLGSLVPEEPRLARKLLDPLANIVQNTQAKSLLYEAVHTITLCLPYCQKSDGSMPSNATSIVSLCAQTLKSFIQEPDQNLKYLGLVGFASLMISHPKVLSDSDYRGLILVCLSDDDITIRTRALDLLIGVATRKNVMELVTQLLHHVDMATGAYKIDLVAKIIDICSSDKYALLTDFAWYMDILVILARTKGIESSNSSTTQKQTNQQQQQKQQPPLGPMISGQITDVTLRVLPVRTYAVRRMISVLLQDGKDSNENSHHNSVGTFGMTTTANMMPEVLPAAAWIVGEYALLIDEAVAMDGENEVEEMDDEDELMKYDSTSVGTYHAIIQALTDPSNIHSAIATTQSVYVQAAMKVFAAATASKLCTDTELEACVSRLTMYLPVYMQSMDTEVQERAFTAFQLLDSFGLVTRSTSHSDTIPSLKLIDDGDDDSDNSVEDEENNNSAHDDLLGLVMSTPAQPSSSSSKNQKQSTIANSLISKSSTDSLAQKSRCASETLKYLLIPEQMKPISAKAQRKKRQSAPASIQAALEEPVNLSVFSNLLEGDRMRVSGGRSIEAVSFTQQKPMRVTSNSAPIKSLNVIEGFGSDSIVPASIPEAAPTKSAELNSGTALNHPFYLNTNENNGNEVKESNNRFGAIQLLDSDGGESDEQNTKKKKKKKDKRRKKKMTDEDLKIFSVADNEPKIMPNIMIDSDEEDDDEPLAAMFHGKMKAPSKSHFEGFDSLAQIDLTTPLREDETMPTMTHRTVPERLADDEEDNINASKKKKKNKKGKTPKKNKETKVSSTTSQANGQAGAIDLLDFSGLSMNASPEGEGATSNPVNSAFDDLLALDMPATTTQTNFSDQLLMGGKDTAEKPKKSHSRQKSPKVWQEAALKASKAEGERVSFDWNDLKLLYRTHTPKRQGQGEVMLIFKLVNNSSSSLQDIQIKLKEGNTSVEFENVESNNSVESRKTGPFSMNLDSFNTEIRGSLTVSGCSIPLKFILSSCTFSFSPLSNLTQDGVTNLLSSGDWFSSTSKIGISGELANDKMKLILKTFLQGHEVEFGHGDNLNSIFASETLDGSKVLVLIKGGNDMIKADVKSTDKSLAKAISSAIKRIVL